LVPFVPSSAGANEPGEKAEEEEEEEEEERRLSAAATGVSKGGLSTVSGYYE